MERNPEFAQIMNNPQLLRESMQLAANPVRSDLSGVTLDVSTVLYRVHVDG